MPRPTIIDTIAKQCRPTVTLAIKQKSPDGENEFYRCHAAFTRHHSTSTEPMNQTRRLLAKVGVLKVDYRERCGFHGLEWVMSVRSARKAVVA